MPRPVGSGTIAGSNNQREAAMLGDLRNLKTSDIELEQRLPTLECEWLVGQMRSQAGIAAARCASDARHPTVQYNADEIRESGVARSPSPSNTAP
jgi:hypothetical protein